jgi:hypothetical protein
MASSRHLDKDWLYDQYVNQERSVTQISEDCKVTRESIIFSLDKFGIYRNWRRNR